MQSPCTCLMARRAEPRRSLGGKNEQKAGAAALRLLTTAIHLAPPVHCILHVYTGICSSMRH